MKLRRSLAGVLLEDWRFRMGNLAMPVMKVEELDSCTSSTGRNIDSTGFTLEVKINWVNQQEGTESLLKPRIFVEKLIVVWEQNNRFDLFGYQSCKVIHEQLPQPNL